VFGRELFPTILEKSAALFHSLIADHPFENGNKRTAVIALDLFMAANGLFLYLDNERMYRMAKDTASYVPQGITHEGMLARIGAELRGSSIRIAKMKEAGLETSVIRTVRDVRKYVREHPYNSAAQEQFFGLDARLPSN
jgi:fido (protein-threonine AMPylation protein)